MCVPREDVVLTSAPDWRMSRAATLFWFVTAYKSEQNPSLSFSANETPASSNT
jgi:hypothetical protein